MNRTPEEWADLDIPCMSLEQSHAWKSHKLDEAIDDIVEQAERIKTLEEELKEAKVILTETVKELFGICKVGTKEEMQAQFVTHWLAAHKEGT